MSEQLALVDVPVVHQLTPRQERALKLIEEAGWDGLTSDELGAHFHQHAHDDRCVWCGSTGAELGRALRLKDLVKQSRRRAPGGDLYMVWTTVQDRRSRETPAAGLDLGDRPLGERERGEPVRTPGTSVPYNVIPY